MANQRIILYRNTNAPAVILKFPDVDFTGYTAELVVTPAAGTGTTFTSPSGGLTVNVEDETVTWQQAMTYVNTLSQFVSARADLYRVLGSYREKLAAFEVQIGGIGDYFETPTYVIQVPGIAGPKGEKGDKGDTGETGEQGEKGDTGDITPELEALRDDAEGFADSAEASADTATTQAAAAAADGILTAADAAATAADVIAANAAVVLAEAARDAAQADAKVYTSTAAGLAAVGEGEQFIVPSADGTENVRYEDVSGVATQRTTYPTAVYAHSLSIFTGRATAVAAERAAYSRVKKLELYGADPTKFYSLKFLFWKDAGTRFNITLQKADDIDGTNAADVATYALGSGADVWTGRREITLGQVSSSGTTGTAVIDFTDTTALAVNSAPASSAVFQRRALNPNIAKNSAARTADIGTSVSSAISSYRGLKVPFADAMTSDLLRRLVKSIWLYGADPSHSYAVSLCTVETFTTPATRFRMTIRDLTASADACAVVKYVSSQPGFATFKATLPDIVKLTDWTLSSRTHVYAVVEFDWSAVSDFFSYGGTSVAAGGVHASRVLSDDMLSDYLDNDHVHEVIKAGAGQTYTTLRAAVESTYSTITGSSAINGVPSCDRSHYHHRVVIRLVDDGIYDATGLYIPDWVEIRGNGIGRTFVNRENTDTDPILEMHHNTKCFDLTIISETAGEYCIHSDDFNRNAAGGVNQNRRILQSFKRLSLVGTTGHNGPLFGCGVSSGQVILLEDVDGYHEDATATFPAFFIHNTGPTVSTPSINSGVKPSQIIMRGSSSPDQLGVYLQTLEPAGIATLSLHACSFNRIEHAVASGEVSGTGADRIQWDILGRYDGAFVNTDPGGDSYTLEWLPSAVPRRRVRNSTGADIPKGRFVKLTGASTIEPCAPGDRPDGWTHAAIADGADGNMVTSRRLGVAYAEGAASSTGEWGVSAGGLIDYGASPKRGRTIGLIVEVY